MDEEKGFTRDELIVYKLGRIESVLTELKDNTKEKIQAHDSKLEDHDKRIDALENLKYWALGAAAVLGILASLIKDFFLNG